VFSAFLLYSANNNYVSPEKLVLQAFASSQATPVGASVSGHGILGTSYQDISFLKNIHDK
jgi:hypothetical protein